MNTTYGAPAVKEVCEYKPVDIKIEDLFDLNWNHWLQGYKMKNKQIDNPSYYIYSILGGIVSMRFNEENQVAVKEFVEKQPKTRFNEAYLAWYDIVHGVANKTYNVAKAAKVPFFELKPKRVALTIDAELEDEKCIFKDTTFDDICKNFVKDVKAALAKEDKEAARELHNKFTSYIMQHIILPDGPKPLFAYQNRTVKHTLPDGTIKEEEKRCDEIHFIVTYEVSVAGKVKVEKKTMPTLPMITGGGRNRSSWTIENILTHGNIIGMIDTQLTE